jgi:hypothetical protein
MHHPGIHKIQYVELTSSEIKAITDKLVTMNFSLTGSPAEFRVFDEIVHTLYPANDVVKYFYYNKHKLTLEKRRFSTTDEGKFMFWILCQSPNSEINLYHHWNFCSKQTFLYMM